MGEQFGPVSLEELRSKVAAGEVVPDTLVRSDIRRDWVLADQIDGLFDNRQEHAVASPAPPPVIPPPVPNQLVRNSSLCACSDCGAMISKRATACPKCGAPRSPEVQSGVIAPSTVQKSATDPFAVLTFATGLLSLLLLPIIFAPLTLVFGMLSYYRLKENPHLKGSWLRICGAICGAIALLNLFVQLGIF